MPFTTTTTARWVAFIAIALLALAIRLPRLGERPMHTDEAVNAFITGNALAGETFKYDPQDRHGPVLYLVAKPIAQLGGAKNFSELTETQLRLTPVIIGSAMILLFGAAVEMFGFIPCLVAALLFAFAPLPVYYSRYFIHETLFVAATFGLILSAWWVGSRCEPTRRRTQRQGTESSVSENLAVPPDAYSAGKICRRATNSTIFAALAGLCAALMLACKETAVIHFFALAIAALAGWWVSRRSSEVRAAVAPSAKIISIAVAVFIAATILLFTSFGQNWSALADLFHAVARFTARAGGEGHAKPLGYYFQILDPLFIFFLVAVAGIFAAISDAVIGTRKASLPLLVYALLTFGIYSAIPYKQPWLALNLWLPIALLCGLGVEAIWQQITNATSRWIFAVAAAALLVTTLQQTKVFVFDKPADEKNPFAYAHTTEDVLGLPGKISELAAAKKLAAPRIAVVAADAWPLPWYLRKFPNTGFWQPGQETGVADFLITMTDVPANLTNRLENFRPEFFGVRPNVLVILWTPEAKP